MRGWEHLQSIYESFNNLHPTNPFVNHVETGSSPYAENLTEVVTMFSDEMSDHLTNAEQAGEMASVTQPNSLRASPNNETYPDDRAKIANPTNRWPPLENTRNLLEGWPNTNRLVEEQDTAETRKGPWDSCAPTTSSSGNHFRLVLDPQNTPTMSPIKQKAKKRPIRFDTCYERPR